MSNAKWKLGLPKRKGHYIFAFNFRNDSTYSLFEANYDPSIQKHPFEYHEWRDKLVAYRNYPRLDQATLDRLYKLKGNKK